MRYLEELEKKVLLLIEKNRDLKARLDVALKESELLREQNRQFEASLLKESNASQSLTEEKAAIVNSIEDLLNSINALENNVRT
jgi:hypothetical protein